MQRLVLQPGMLDVPQATSKCREVVGSRLAWGCVSLSEVAGSRLVWGRVSLSEVAGSRLVWGCVSLSEVAGSHMLWGRVSFSWHVTKFSKVLPHFPQVE